jgi:mRNA-degrading endonuclease RelE of RelBE toxin-antitoxin system
MNKIEKLFRKIGVKDREELLHLLEKLISGDSTNLDILKLKGSDMYRVRSGRYRIIFHFEKKEVVIDAVRLRDEKTYRG